MGLYHSDHRSLQERFDTVRLADRLEKVKVLDHIADDDRGGGRPQVGLLFIDFEKQKRLRVNGSRKQTDWARDVLPANDPARKT